MSVWRKPVLKGLKKNPKGVIQVRSSWEKEVVKVLESNKNVSKWVYEYPIRYIDPIKKRKRVYFLDFLVWLKSGKKVAIEVKSPSLLKFNKNYKSTGVKYWHIKEVIRNQRKLQVLQERAIMMGWKVLIVMSMKDVKALDSKLYSL